jgi:hypothetical protein
VEVLAEKRWSNSMLVMKGLTAVEVGVEVGVERLSGDDDEDRADVTMGTRAEMWVRKGQKSKPKQGFLVPTRCWVDHRKRVVQFDNVPVANGDAKGKGKKVEADDREW